MRRRRPVYDYVLQPLADGDDPRAWADSHEPGSPPWIAAQASADEALAFGGMTSAEVVSRAEFLLQLEAAA